MLCGELFSVPFLRPDQIGDVGVPSAARALMTSNTPQPASATGAANRQPRPGAATVVTSSRTSGNALTTLSPRSGGSFTAKIAK